MAIWWMTECAPLPVTSLLPVVLLPLFGVMSSEAVAAEYFNSTVMLFLGGFLIALAIQRWNVHRHIALSILRVSGSSPRGLLLTFMAATAFISWWVNNTATTMMMLPIAVAITTQLAAEFGEEKTAGFTRSMLLAAAYASSIGGLATPVGTPTNLILMRQYELLFPDAPQITFGHWMLFFVPLSTMLLLVCWLLLERLCGGLNVTLRGDIIKKELRELGPMRIDQRIVFAVFCAAAVLWITRSPVEIGSRVFPGWGMLFSHIDAAGKLLQYVDDGTVAIALAAILFLIPSRTPGSGGLMRWEDTRHLPWGTVILFGGGFALAEAFAASGLGDWFGMQLTGLGYLHPLLLILAIYGTITLLSEFASNTAASQLVLPIVASVAAALGLPPLTLMLAAANGASLDFILPSSTPPNAMVLATGKVSVAQMVRIGAVIEGMCLIVVSLVIYFFGSKLA